MLLHRARNLLKFRLERWLVRGTAFRLLLIAGVIVLMSFGCGVLVLVVAGGFKSVGAAVWWAFLRLTDPGYLGNDEGLVRRLVSTFLTVMGYVVFTGALVAIMTQWLDKTMRNLEGGFTAIAEKDHVLVAGWTSRTPTIFAEVLLSEGRVERFLERHDASRLSMVLLAETVGVARRFELRERLGKLYDDRIITLRSGSALRIAHLERADFANAAAIVLPAEDADTLLATEVDTHTIKTLLSMNSRVCKQEEPSRPLVVTEILDARKRGVAIQAYQGPLEVVASDLLVGSMLGQIVLQPSLARVFDELVTERAGNDVHIYQGDKFSGSRFERLDSSFPHAVVLGLARPTRRSHKSMLCPTPSQRVRPGDRVVVIAQNHEDALPSKKPARSSRTMAKVRAGARTIPRTKLLIVGWSTHVVGVIRELSAHALGIVIDVVSVVPPEKRETAYASYTANLPGGVENPAIHDATVHHHQNDVTVPTALLDFDLLSYDCVLVAASDWTASDEERDARTIVSYLMLLEALRKTTSGEANHPRVIVEITDESNAELFDDHVAVFNSSLMIGRILGQVALRPELRAVYEDLFGVQGGELMVQPPSVYQIPDDFDAPFDEWQAVIATTGDVLLGLFDAEDELLLNPPKTRRFSSVDVGDLVVLTDEAESAVVVTRTSLNTSAPV